jgi:hypothetical protein
MKKRTLERQIWLEGTEKPCPHDMAARQTLVTEGGSSLCEICGACQMRIAEYGPCERCGDCKRLVRFRGAHRFCGGTCETAWDVQRKLDARRKRAEFVGERGVRGDKR